MQPQSAEPGWSPLPYRMNLGVVRQQGPGGELPSEGVIGGAFLFENRVIDLARLQRAVEHVVSSNPALRSRYRVAGGRAEYQEETGWVPDVDLRSAPASLDETGWTALADRVRRDVIGEGFDLRDGRLLRIALVTDDSSRSAMIVVADHTVCDGASYGQVLADLSSAYNAGVSDGDHVKPRATLADVARDESALLSKRQDSILGKWLERHPRGIPELRVNHDEPWTPEVSNEGGSFVVRLQGESYQTHRAECARGRTTPFVLAATKILRAVAADVVSGELSFISPLPGRTVPSAYDVCGNFVNLLPVVPGGAAPDDAPAFLRSVQQAVGWTLATQQLPFAEIAAATAEHDEVVETLPERRRAIFLATQSPSRVELDGAVGRPIPSSRPSALFDLSVWINDDGGSLEASVVHRLAWVPAEQARNWVESLAEPLF